MYNVKMVLLLLLKNILSILENWKTVYNMSGMFNGLHLLSQSNCILYSCV